MSDAPARDLTSLELVDELHAMVAEKRPLLVRLYVEFSGGLRVLASLNGAVRKAGDARLGEIKLGARKVPRSNPIAVQLGDDHTWSTFLFEPDEIKNGRRDGGRLWFNVGKVTYEIIRLGRQEEATNG